MSDTDASFLSRWSRRKAADREGKPVPEEAQAPAVPPRHDVALPAQEPVAPAAESLPLPTLADVAQLRPGDNIARFVAQGVDESVKRAALKTLFADPHFNVMDGLDTYIDDYTKPDPIPLDVLRKLTQSETLGLFAAPEADSQPQQGQVTGPKQQADEAAAPAPEASAESEAESAPDAAPDTAADKHA
ncbi:DUF3306 domain-containing protein [Cupriavidus sp. BIS7]|uniref:DUF3306 domain-containing protein n=1 Tax=Cupriavidus sp. BIS7 TaxID=1217718 RepID=UPI0003012373|nr:DUF3306 domain-containing protein [Cupriavidus sp. BIS7]